MGICTKANNKSTEPYLISKKETVFFFFYISIAGRNKTFLDTFGYFDGTSVHSKFLIDLIL